MKNKKIKDYIYEINSNFSDLELLSIPKRNSSIEKIKIRCKIHNIIFDSTLRDIVRGYKKCPQCCKSKKLNHEGFVKLIYSFHSNIKILSEFKNLKSIISCYCLQCSHRWETKAINLKRKSNCPVCSNKDKNNRIKKEKGVKYKKEIEKKFPFIIPLEEYNTYRKKIKFKCLKCNYIFLSDYYLLSKTDSGCNNCNSKKRKDEKEVLKKLKENHPYLELLDENYKGISKKYNFKCKRCNSINKISLKNLLDDKTSCPSCRSTSGERKIESALKKYNIKYETQHTFKDLVLERLLRCDFYIPSVNMVVEYNGKQHYEPIEFFGGEEYFIIVQKRDNIKKEYCKKNNISFLEISYLNNNYNDIEHILKNNIGIGTNLL